MKLFLDTAHIAAIEPLIETGLIDGVTTNPSLLALEKTDPLAVVKKICALLPDGSVSVEVTEQDPDAVRAQAYKIAKIAPNVAVKIPCYQPYFGIIRELTSQGIAVNVTLVFSLVQAVCVAKLGATYVSAIVGRLDDSNVDGMLLVREMRQAFDTYGFAAQILVASVRHVRHVHESLLAGADVATISVPVFEKMTRHPFSISGMAAFEADWQNAGFTTFV